MSTLFKNMFLTFSVDDGSNYDLYLLKLLEEYNIPCIFYIPNNCELSEENIKEISEKGFEIGGHTVSHPRDMKLLTESQQMWEIVTNKEYLEGITGKSIESFAYPRGKFNKITQKVVELAGFENARTVNVLNMNFPQDLYREHPTIHVHPNRREYEGENWLKIAKEKFCEAARKDGYYHIWGHSWEMEKFGLWEDLEELFNFLNLNRKQWDNI